MQTNNLRKLITNGLITVLAIFVLSSFVTAQPGDEKRPPELPQGCGQIQVQAGNKVSFHTYALGVQIYRWNGTGWDFVAPSAKLFADRGFRGLVGEHYAGPTWESNSGSSVVARRVDGCTPDANSIPWLLLQAVTTSGPGIFSRTTFIQRTNTVGGTAPGTPGPFPGFEQQVPYVAEYYFYRADN